MRPNNWKSKMKRGTAAFLSLLLWMVFSCPVFAFAQEADGGEIHIQTQDDLKELAENCRLDTWSYGKTVILDNDLVLDETADEFLPIPTFGGTFEGNGHTLSGLSLDGDDSRAGLFDTLQASAVINRLTVVGQMSFAARSCPSTIFILVLLLHIRLASQKRDSSVQSLFPSQAWQPEHLKYRLLRAGRIQKGQIP